MVVFNEPTHIIHNNLLAVCNAITETETHVTYTIPMGIKNIKPTMRLNADYKAWEHWYMNEHPTDYMNWLWDNQ